MNASPTERETPDRKPESDATVETRSDRERGSRLGERDEPEEASRIRARPRRVVRTSRALIGVTRNVGFFTQGYNQWVPILRTSRKRGRTAGDGRDSDVRTRARVHFGPSQVDAMEPVAARQRPIGLAAHAARKWFSRVEPTVGLPTAQTTGMRPGHKNPVGFFS